MNAKETLLTKALMVRLEMTSLGSAPRDIDMGPTLEAAGRMRPAVEFWLPLLTHPNEWLDEWKVEYPTVFGLYADRVAHREWKDVEQAVHRWAFENRCGLSMEVMEHLLFKVPPMEEAAIKGTFFGGSVDESVSATIVDARSFWRKAEERLIALITTAARHAMQHADPDDNDAPGLDVIQTLTQYGLRISVDPNQELFL